jgi:anti-sigma regulatory factor (Ser/Thr protein kinase)
MDRSSVCGGEEAVMCSRRERRFTSTPNASAQARRFARDELTKLLRPGAAVADVLEQVELLTSEVAANAVKFSREAFEVDLAVHHTWIQVGVVDQGPGWPEVQDPDPHEPGGRGLRIVAAIATDWGAEQEPVGGKMVWFRLPLPNGAAAHLDCDQVTAPPVGAAAGRFPRAGQAATRAGPIPPHIPRTARHPSPGAR